MTNPYQFPGLPEPTPPQPDPQIPPYAPPPAYYPQPPYPPPGYSYPAPYQPTPPTEGLAIASLIVSCAAVVGLCTYGVGSLLGIVGAILGHVARHRIKRNGNSGDGLALAGIIVGWVLTAISLLAAAAIMAYVFTDRSVTT